jgi:hypothetical protein
MTGPQVTAKSDPPESPRSFPPHTHLSSKSHLEEDAIALNDGYHSAVRVSPGLERAASPMDNHIMRTNEIKITRSEAGW